VWLPTGGTNLAELPDSQLCHQPRQAEGEGVSKQPPGPGHQPQLQPEGEQHGVAGYRVGHRVGTHCFPADATVRWISFRAQESQQYACKDGTSLFLARAKIWNLGGGKDAIREVGVQSDLAMQSPSLSLGAVRAESSRFRGECDVQ